MDVSERQDTQSSSNTGTFDLLQWLESPGPLGEETPSLETLSCEGGEVSVGLDAAINNDMPFTNTFLVSFESLPGVGLTDSPSIQSVDPSVLSMLSPSGNGNQVFRTPLINPRDNQEVIGWRITMDGTRMLFKIADMDPESANFVVIGLTFYLALLC